MPAATNTDHRMGKDCKAYHNTGTNATPVWAECERVQDVSVNQAKTKVDLPRRGLANKTKGSGQKERSISFGYLYKPGTADTDFDVLLDSFDNDSTFEMAIMDGPIATTGTEGLRIFVEVFDFPFTQAIEEAMSFQVGVEHVAVDEGSGIIAPTWYTVA